jgi:hypothetical protein
MKRIRIFAKILLRGVKITLLRTVVFSIIIMLVFAVWKGERDFGALWNVGVLSGGLLALLYPLGRKAYNSDFLKKYEYKKDLAIIQLHDTVIFSEYLKRNLDKNKSERCGLYLLSDRLVFQKNEGNVEIALSYVKDVYPVRESLLAKLILEKRQCPPGFAFFFCTVKENRHSLLL